MPTEIRIDLASVLQAGGPGIADYVDKLGTNITDDAKRFVPTDTTALQSKISGEGSGVGAHRVYVVGVADGTVSTVKGPKTPSGYWEFVERGTSRAPAQPFFRPALYANVGR